MFSLAVQKRQINFQSWCKDLVCDNVGPHENAHKNHVKNELKMLERFGYVQTWLSNYCCEMNLWYQMKIKDIVSQGKEFCDKIWRFPQEWKCWLFCSRARWSWQAWSKLIVLELCLPFYILAIMLFTHTWSWFCCRCWKGRLIYLSCSGMVIACSGHLVVFIGR